MSHVRSQLTTWGRRGAMLDRRDACPTPRRAFTLIEAMISMAVLLVIILFTSTIFSGVSRVTGVGQGNADVMTEIAAIEQQVRRDFERLSREGYLSIISRAVRNDINDPTRSGMIAGTDPRFWLDPNREPLDYIRSDRIVFFTQGVSTVQHYVPPSMNQGDNRKAQTNVARVYYGHGFQLGAFPRLAGASAGASIDPNPPNNFDFPPWDIGNNGNVIFEGGSFADGFFQPPAPRWTLARQNVLLGDDGGGQTRYLLQGLSTDTIWNFEIRNSRADVAATQLNDLRRIITAEAWGRQQNQQQDLMLDSMLYPRAEAVDLTNSDLNVDKTLHVLGTAVSDFMIDWTYENGTGFTPDPINPPTPYEGVTIPYAGETPWFGLPDRALGQILATQDRGVFMLGDEPLWRVDSRGPIFPGQIEFLQADLYQEMTNDLLDISYVATFGYNQTRPLNPLTGRPWPTDDRNTYTPWPSALRFTMRVHDPGTRLPRGRLVQFVITLPKRTK